MAHNDTSAEQPDLDRAFWLLLHDTQRRCEAADGRLTQLERGLSGRLEARSYRTFVEVLRLLTANTRSEMSRRARVFQETDTEQKAAQYKLVRNVAEHFSSEVETAIRLLETPRAERVELIAGPMTRLVKQVVPRAEVVFLPWGQSGYAIETFTPGDADRLLPAGGAALRREFGPIEILQMRYPAARSNDLFQHAVFAHELAHAALERPTTASDAEESEDSDAGEETERPPRHTWDSAAAGAVPTNAGQDVAVLRGWFTELACDILATRLIGPVFVAAYAEVTTVHRRSAPENTVGKHPAPGLRFRILGQELDRFAAGLPERIATPLRTFARVHEGTHGSAAPTPRAAEWLDAAIERLRSEQLPRLFAQSGAEYRPSRLAEDLHDVRSALQRGRYAAERIVAFDKPPPRQWSTSLDWRSILNASFLEMVAENGAPSAGVGIAEAKHRREAIAAAAGGIELSELHRRATALIAQAEGLTLPQELA